MDICSQESKYAREERKRQQPVQSREPSPQGTIPTPSDIVTSSSDEDKRVLREKEERLRRTRLMVKAEMENSRRVREEEQARPRKKRDDIYSKGVAKPGTQEYRDALEIRETRGQREYASGDEEDENDDRDMPRLRSVSRERVVLKNAEGTYDKFSMHYNTLSAGDDTDGTFLNLSLIHI